MSLFMLTLVACKQNDAPATTNPTVEETVDNYKMTIASPGGAPAISIATLINDYKDEYTYTPNLEPQALKPLFQKKEMDAIFAPVNMGATLYSKTQGYQLGAVVTWGNLYIASQKPDFKLEDLNNMPLTIFSEKSVNDAIVKKILDEKNLKPTEIKYLGDAKATQQQLIADKDGNEAYLVAEPSLTVAKSKKPNITSISVQNLYKEVSGNKEFAQAGVFINVNTIRNHKSVVDKFLTRLKESCDITKEDTAKAADNAILLGGFPPKEALAKAIPNCNIKYASAINSKESIEGLVELNPGYFGGAKPVDEFYYEG